MSSCRSGIKEKTRSAPMPSVEPNKEGEPDLPGDNKLCEPVDEFYGFAGDERKWITMPERGRVRDLSHIATDADAESGPTTWEGKLMTLTQVVEQSRPQFLRLAQRITNSREEAEDVVQEALLKAFKNLAQFRGDSKMGTWLFAIVQNTGREWMRKQRGRVYMSLEFARNSDDDALVDDIQEPGRNPEQLCECLELDRLVRSEIDKLCSVSKCAIRMCCLDELSNLDAANALGVSVCTIKSRIFHGKRTLKRALRGARANEMKYRPNLSGCLAIHE